MERSGGIKVILEDGKAIHNSRCRLCDLLGLEDLYFLQPWYKKVFVWIFLVLHSSSQQMYRVRISFGPIDMGEIASRQEIYTIKLCENTDMFCDLIRTISHLRIPLLLLVQLPSAYHVTVEMSDSTN